MQQRHINNADTVNDVLSELGSHPSRKLFDWHDTIEIIKQAGNNNDLNTANGVQTVIQEIARLETKLFNEGQANGNIEQYEQYISAVEARRVLELTLIVLGGRGDVKTVIRAEFIAIEKESEIIAADGSPATDPQTLN